MVIIQHYYSILYHNNVNMKEISKYIKKFINKEFLCKNKKYWESQIPKFSETSLKMIGNILNDIKEGDNYWDLNNRYIKESDLDFEKDGLPKGYSYNYIIPEIRDILETRRKIGKQFVFNIGHQEVFLFIIYPFSEDDPVEKVSKKKMDLFLKDCLHKVFLWLFVANKQRHSECSQKLHIYLYLSELFKLLPENGDVFDMEHANTAFTTSCNPDTTIHLFREEEWFKVFIHESFHCLGFDFSSSNTLCEMSKRQITDVFSVKSDVNFFETYCEMSAEFLNIIFYEYFKNKNQDILLFIENIRNGILYEKIFSCFQCVKVLNFLKIKYKQLYSKDKTSKQIVEDNYKEKTNILSYFVLKSIYMVHIDDFLKWITDNNFGSFNFSETSENLDSFMKIIFDNIDNPLFLRNIEIMELWFSKRTNKNCLEDKTLRMTLFEM